MSTVTNPAERELRANVEGVDYVIPPLDSIDVASASAAVTLCEYGATMAKDDYEAALEVAAERARELNSRHASASASESAILSRQSTVTVATGTVDNAAATPGGQTAEDLAGKALAAALAQRGLPTKGTADAKRELVRAFDAGEVDATGQPVTHVTDLPKATDDTSEFELDAEGNVVLDEDGNPVPKGTDGPKVDTVVKYALDENGDPVLDEDGKPLLAPTVAEQPTS